MSQQFIRKVGLFVTNTPLQADELEQLPLQPVIIDLSQMQMQFKTSNQDDEGPNNCNIRVFNLGETTTQKLLQSDVATVILQAGYQDGPYGVIFKGNIKQFRTGRLSAVDSYVDILAADGDLGYNFTTVSESIANASNNAAGQKQALFKAFAANGIVLGKDLSQTGGTLPRGKVLWGMAKTLMRKITDSQGCTWSIQNGQINIIPLTGYLPGEAVVLNGATGLIGIPEQTAEGVKVRALLNPLITVGGLIKLDNALVNQTISQQQNIANLAFGQWSNPQYLAKVSTDGLYRVYVAEYQGDIRGNDWYVDLTCLAVDSSSNEVKPYG